MLKKLFIAFVCTLGLLGLTSCEEEHLYPNELQGHWVLMDSSTKDDGAAKSLLALTFEHDMLFVEALRRVNVRSATATIGNGM